MCDCIGLCDCDKTVPKGDQGDPGDPMALFMSFITAGAGQATTSTSYVLLGEFIFDAATMEVFTSLKANCYMDGGTGSFKISVKGGATLYEKTDVSATSDTNVESVTGLDIVPANDTVVQIFYKSNNVADTMYFDSIAFGYGE